MKKLLLGLITATTLLTVQPGTAIQVKSSVARAPKITRLTADQARAVPQLSNQTAERMYKLPSLCTPSTCVFGDKQGRKIVAVYGDSHVRMWLPAILPTLTAAHYRVIVVGRDGCWYVDLNLSPKCEVVRTNALAQIATLKPSLTILSNYTGIGVTNIRHPSAAAWQTGLTAVLQAISGPKIVIGDITQMSYDPSLCLAAFPTDVQKCTAPNPNVKWPTLQSAEVAATKALGVPYIDPRPWLCTKVCSPVIGRFLVYWSSNHVTTQYAAYLSKVMGAALTKDTP